MTSFIEDDEWPEFEISCESYKERMANAGQTLVGLGKWWGRKPLVLIRAILLGCLLPATNRPKRDREIFLKLMTMDNSGLLKRKKEAVAPTRAAELLPSHEREAFLVQDNKGKWSWRGDISTKAKKEIEAKAFSRLPYEEKLRHCLRPEEIDGPDSEGWAEINAHLATNASSLWELVQQLGKKRFGRVPHLGDVFCGGGSIPFEAARLGCAVYASDLNPVACLLTWGALKLLDTSKEEAAAFSKQQEELLRAVEEQIATWKIEQNSSGWRADAFLYCIETSCPECGWKVPLAPSWVISQKLCIICSLIPDEEERSFQFKIEEATSEEEFKRAAKGTVSDKKMHCPHCKQSVAISTLRGDRKGPKGRESDLRLWEKSDFQPRQGDLYRERLYCIRWLIPEEGKRNPKRFYAAPTKEDLRREEKVAELLREWFEQWQKEGFIPSRFIESGNETDRLMRERGWTHWHHLFNPRQLLFNGLLSSLYSRMDSPFGAIKLSKLLDYSSKLCYWDSMRDSVGSVFVNQALNPLWNFAVKNPLSILHSYPFEKHRCTPCYHLSIGDAQKFRASLDIAITDPPYADAVNYDELSEFFLSWLEPHLKNHFPDWYIDSKRALAIRGKGDSFSKSMVAAYRNLAEQMADNGIQVVLWNHNQCIIPTLEESGLEVIKIWHIKTEVSSSLRKGNVRDFTQIVVCRRRDATQEGKEQIGDQRKYPRDGS